MFLGSVWQRCWSRPLQVVVITMRGSAMRGLLLTHLDRERRKLAPLVSQRDGLLCVHGSDQNQVCGCVDAVRGGFQDFGLLFGIHQSLTSSFLMRNKNALTISAL